MSYHPDYKENIADGVIKDMNIDKLRKLTEQYKKEADEWRPRIVVDEKALDEKAVQWTISLNVDGVPQGLTFTLNKNEIVYLQEGDVLIETIADQLAILFKSRLRAVLASSVKRTVDNIRLQAKVGK
jgi:response regulator of citrate/malate metabolism